MNLPRNIFIYWHSGFQHTNRLVSTCARTWAARNREWKVMLLDNRNVHEHTLGIDIPEPIFEALPIQKKANMIRLKLLLEHGGVWADATLFCNRELDGWIDECARSGAFMFDNPGPDREIANWFIAAEPGNYLIQRLYEAQCEYWTRNDFNHDSWTMRKVKPLFNRALNRSKPLTRFWFTPLATRILQIYSYHIFHHHFYKLTQEDQQFREIWQGRRPLPAKGASLIQSMGMTSQMTPEQREAIDQDVFPVYKLAHSVDDEQIQPGTPIYYLFDHTDTRL